MQNRTYSGKVSSQESVKKVKESCLNMWSVARALIKESVFAPI